MKIGLDIHGVLNKDPKLFRAVCTELKKQGHEIHVITGREICDKLHEELKEIDIPYDYLFSITSHHKEIGTYIKYKDGDLTQPLIAPPKWDRTKGDYAKNVGLDIHIDDSEVYGYHFPLTTQYIIFTPAIQQMLNAILTAGLTAFWQ